MRRQAKGLQTDGPGPAALTTPGMSLWDDAPAPPPPRRPEWAAPQQPQQPAPRSDSFFTGVAYESTGSRWNAFTHGSDDEDGYQGGGAAARGAEPSQQPSLWDESAAKPAKRRKKKKQKARSAPPAAHSAAHSLPRAAEPERQSPVSFFQEGTASALRRPAESGAAQERGADGYSGPTAPRARGQRTLGDFVLRPSSSDSGADSPVVDLTGERREGAAGRAASSSRMRESAADVLQRANAFKRSWIGGGGDRDGGSGTEEHKENEGQRRSRPKTKRGPSGYNVFDKATRAQLQRDDPQLEFGDGSRAVGARWKGMSEEEKRPFEEQAQQERERLAAPAEDAEQPASKLFAHRGASTSISLSSISAQQAKQDAAQKAQRSSAGGGASTEAAPVRAKLVAIRGQAASKPADGFAAAAPSAGRSRTHVHTAEPLSAAAAARPASASSSRGKKKPKKKKKKSKD